MPETGNVFRRSSLYVPASNSRALAKTLSLAADVLVFDLEEAVLPEQKHTARARLTEHLEAASHTAERVVRINSPNSPAYDDDLAWLEAGPEIDAVLLPKVRGADDVIQLRQALKAVNQSLPIWIMVETVDAVLRLENIVGEVDRSGAMLLGAEDLAREMRITQTPGRLGLLSVLTKLVLCGRSAGLSILDAVYTNINDHNGLRQACEQGRNLGFDGKTVIHPGQIKIANQVFSPQPDEIDNARKIIEAWSSRPAGAGVVTVDGKLVEQLHVDQASELLVRADGL